MALSDPIVVTYAGAAKSLALSGRTENSSTYLLNDAGVSYKLTVEHNYAKRNRVTARLQRTAWLADPQATGQNTQESLSAQVSADFSPLHTAADAQALYNALLTAVTSAIFLRIAGGET